jgi:hypothetical protein
MNESLHSVTKRDAALAKRIAEAIVKAARSGQTVNLAFV